MMNLAEKLNNWKKAEHTIVAAEQALKDYIGAKVRFEVGELKKNANNNENGIGVRLVEYSSFMRDAIAQISAKYGKNVEEKYFHILVKDALHKNNNIHITKVPEIPNGYLIWELNNINEHSNITNEIVKLWLEEIVLKDFERKFKEFFSKNLVTPAAFHQTYSCEPILAVIRRLPTSFLERLEIDQAFTLFLKETGLQWNYCSSLGELQLSIE